MKPAVLLCLALVPLFASPAYALDKPQPADSQLIADCLALVAKNDAAGGPRDPDEATETPGAAGRLAGAALEAPRQQESCIGVVSTKCVQDQNGVDVDGIESDCYLREQAIWDARLNDAYRTARAGMEHDAAVNLEKTERAWIAFRDLSCAQPYAVFQGSMAGPMEAWCGMNLTARQALWMAAWNN